VIDNPATEPPPAPPRPVGRLLVQISGNGTVTLSQRTLQGGSPAAQIRCGVKGLSCYAELAPQARVTLTARPEARNVFTGWTGGCSGRQPTCTVTATQARAVSATFAFPQLERVSAVRFKLTKPSIRAQWSTSVGRGTLVVRGSVSARATLRVQLRRPGGGPLFTRKFRVSGGPFRLTRALRSGTLARGATLLPGGFVLAIRGAAGRIPLPLQVRTVVVQSPGEGVVRRAFFTISRNGSPQTRLAAGVREAWAIFRFATQPTRGPIVATWYAPNGQVIGTSTKSNRPSIATGIGSGIGLAAGTFRVELSTGGRVIRRLNVVVR
jgi:hypothetical protein